MNSRIIHPEVPFTTEEWAVPEIVFGAPAEEALHGAEILRSELSAQDADMEGRADGGAGWFTSSPRVVLAGQTAAVLHLFADIHSGGSRLSAEAREAWRDRLDLNLDSADVERILNEFEKLGPGWSSRRAEFEKLLSHRSHDQ
jgi:hypothetical protein